jgi:hypothetical protein
MLYTKSLVHFHKVVLYEGKYIKVFLAEYFVYFISKVYIEITNN